MALKDFFRPTLASKAIRDRKDAPILLSRLSHWNKSWNSWPRSGNLCLLPREAQATSDTLRKLELAEYDKIPRLWGDEFTRLLHRITGELGKVLIILDGVAADVTTKALTYLILAINPDGGSDQIIQVLFTSQAPPPIEFSTLHQIVKTQIRASDADVKKYIIRALQSISGKDLSSSHSELVKGLVRTFDGRYFWFASGFLGLGLAKAVPEAFVQDFRQLSSRKGSIESYQQAAEANPFENETSYDELEEYHERWHCLAALPSAPAYLIDVLVAFGEDLEARDCLGRTALHLAAETEGDISIMKSLVEAGAKVFAKDDDAGDTPLVNAVIHGGPASVKFLLGNGAEISELNEGILKQCRQENPDVAVYLQELGIDAQAADESEAED
ncbi:hypothetical protein BFJ66_g15903 [Fusarium oxysporum f. sp. cepae]|nr:hypothetical protein BFJ65_g10504 [Fusarium oxysporum f. sp. cepae]RKK27991.1 hypothetical protein BFJ67_g15827 [Fusarium oxysporum f. sp. cepae]RKK31312.1 hypothetical protein BFJ66_g15903 [Fusarium oxysporum f. sp. cepae]